MSKSPRATKPCPFCGKLDEPHTEDCFIALYEKWLLSDFAEPGVDALNEAWDKRFRPVNSAFDEAYDEGYRAGLQKARETCNRGALLGLADVLDYEDDVRWIAERIRDALGSNE